MDKISKFKFYKNISPYSIVVSDYGQSLCESISSEMLMSGGLLYPDVKEYKKACLNLGIIGLYISELLFKSKPVRTSLHTDNFTTFGCASISRSKLPVLSQS